MNNVNKIKQRRALCKKSLQDALTEIRKLKRDKEKALSIKPKFIIRL